MRQVQFEGMTDSEKNDFINFIYGQLKEREAQNEALHVKLDAQMISKVAQIPQMTQIIITNTN